MTRLLPQIALLPAPLAALRAGDAPKQKPNVVLLLADDQRFDEGQRGRSTPAEATDLARRLRPASIQMGKTDRRYDDQ